MGSEYFDDLAFLDSDVRAQCERELKVVSIAMRQGLLASSGRDEALLELAEPLVEHLVRTLRGLLWLKGRREPHSEDQVASAIEQLIGRQLAGVRRLVDGSASATWDAFRELYANVQDLGQHVNAD